MSGRNITAECHLVSEEVGEEVVSLLVVPQAPHLVQLLPPEGFHLVRKLQLQQQEEAVSRLLMNLFKKLCGTTKLPPNGRKPKHR